MLNQNRDGSRCAISNRRLPALASRTVAWFRAWDIPEVIQFSIPVVAVETNHDRLRVVTFYGFNLAMGFAGRSPSSMALLMTLRKTIAFKLQVRGLRPIFNRLVMKSFTCTLRS